MFARLFTMSLSVVSCALAFQIIVFLNKTDADPASASPDSTRYTFDCTRPQDRHYFLAIYPLLGALFSIGVILQEFLAPLLTPVVKLFIIMIDVLFITLAGAGLSEALFLLSIYSEKGSGTTSSSGTCPRASIHTFALSSVILISMSLVVWLTVFVLTMLKHWWRSGLQMKGLPRDPGITYKV